MIKKTKSESLTIEHRGLVDCPSIPWKNLKGVTREIGKDNNEPFLWRLSSAVLREDAPFSDFSQYDRVLCLIEGGPIVLSHLGGKQRQLEKMVPYNFSGKLKTEALVSVLSVDLNLFLLKGKSKGAIYPVYFNSNEEYQFPLSAYEHFVFCIQGKLTVVERYSQQKFTLNSNEWIRMTRLGKKEYPNLQIFSSQASSKALWIPIHRL